MPKVMIYSHDLKDLVPRGFGARMKEMEKGHRQRARQLHQSIQE